LISARPIDNRQSAISNESTIEDHAIKD